ncbi:MAG: hypothetical protein WCE21_05620 [Candidatus Babeliales bacterium]
MQYIVSLLLSGIVLVQTAIGAEGIAARTVGPGARFSSIADKIDTFKLQWKYKWGMRKYADELKQMQDTTTDSDKVEKLLQKKETEYSESLGETGTEASKRKKRQLVLIKQMDDLKRLKNIATTLQRKKGQESEGELVAPSKSKISTMSSEKLDGLVQNIATSKSLKIPGVDPKGMPLYLQLSKLEDLDLFNELFDEDSQFNKVYKNVQLLKTELQRRDIVTQEQYQTLFEAQHKLKTVTLYLMNGRTGFVHNQLRDIVVQMGREFNDGTMQTLQKKIPESGHEHEKSELQFTPTIEKSMEQASELPITEPSQLTSLVDNVTEDAKVLVSGDKKFVAQKTPLYTQLAPLDDSDLYNQLTMENSIFDQLYKKIQVLDDELRKETLTEVARTQYDVLKNAYDVLKNAYIDLMQVTSALLTVKNTTKYPRSHEKLQEINSDLVLRRSALGGIREKIKK